MTFHRVLRYFTIFTEKFTENRAGYEQQNPPSHQVIRGIVITSLHVFSRSLQDRALLSVYTRTQDVTLRSVPCR